MFLNSSQMVTQLTFFLVASLDLFLTVDPIKLFGPLLDSIFISETVS